MFARRLIQVGAMMAIGDGVIGMLHPRRHAELWEQGPPGYRDLVHWCAEHPDRTRVLGALEAAFGLWLATRQLPPR